MPRLILASASPRRQQLLAEAGYRFVAHPADVDESAFPPDLFPADVAALLAQRKSEVVAERFPDDVVLAADTVVSLGQQMLGKPADAADARRILGALAGTHHETITAVVVACRSAGFRQSRVVRSSVSMRSITTAELDAYIASGLWEGKAGAYGIQDDDPFVTRIDGSLSNIVGLPMDETREMLLAAGIRPGDGPAGDRTEQDRPDVR